ncbi:hypothetical protein JMN32_06680 [Fulvivirga sp. 29W222]|uniref:Uncharacterized protein n=1 Tax=Fulvivirga marina TaxID=2494733 RepID=A0A937FX29_9BACT|nr:hypothetical protein [Fulvivirga marina]MBL6445986.1 hypothetical protein [Fulvivirga marina]
MKILCNTLLILMLCASMVMAQVPNKEDQINAAIQAAPEEQREGASVLGYDAKGNLVMIKEGTNELICLADDPNKEGFSVACYHKDLEPFMTRGRELYAEGKNRGEVFKIREQEVKEKKLKMPDQPTTLHVLSGSDGKYDPATGKVTGANLRYVVYIPFATAESTGLPIRPMVPGGPWIMDPGTHRAHIMISPPALKENEDK